MTEAWLGGPVSGVPAWLQPAAHAFLQSQADLRRAAESLSLEQLHARPGGAASIAFHVRHVAGATDRLLTYARGAELDDAQRAFLAREGEAGTAAGVLLAELDAAVERALEQLRSTPEASLLEPRHVGRKRLPSSVLGLLFHAAEHSQRHAGQAATTVKLVQGDVHR
jgi:uncharacterized damage-inducible protein DinB